ncbi:MAG: molybdopterin-dependent oxidoreductase [Syntrophorhabdales bacterium]|jgi:anaerobic selenocysteine-containing dehydrogenase
MSKNTKLFFTGCALCDHSCGAEVTVENGRVLKVEGQKSHPLNKGRLCPKGQAMIEHLYHPDRLKYPLKKVKGRWQRITWDRAVSEIAEKLKKLKAMHGPSVLAFFLGSKGVENLETTSLTQRFKAAFGSPNFFSVESICFRMRLRSRQFTFGKYLVEELDSNLYILWGHNPAVSDLPLALAIKENIRKGAKVIVIDPRKIPIADKAEMYLAIRPGTDGALALALMYVMIKERLYDAAFVEKWTYGFDKLVRHIQQYTPEWAERITWVKADDIRTLARRFAGIRGAAIYHGTCTQDQSANGSQTDRAFAILQTLTGNINVPGGWVISPRLRLADISLPFPGKPLGTEEYPLFYQMWGRTSVNGVMNMVPESVPDKLKAFIVAGGNPLVTMPDSNALRDAFRKLDLVVVYDQFMTETAEFADYVLPAVNQLELWGLAYNYNVCHCLPYLMLRQPVVEPYYECRSIRSFYTDLAEACGFGDKFPWKSDDELVAHELEPSGVSFEMLKTRPEGLHYKGKTYDLKKGSFATPTGKIEIYSEAFKEAGFDPIPTYREPDKGPRGSRWAELGEKYPLILSTGTRNVFFTGTMLHNIKSLRLRSPFPKAELGPKTAEQYGIGHGDDIVIETDRGRVTMKASVDERTMEGVVLVPHGWPREGNCNLLTDCNCREPIMGYPQWKGLLCSIRKADMP